MKLQKYAMVVINMKHCDGKKYVRRVLISYKKKKRSQEANKRCDYLGTKIIATDLYFTDADSSHKYLFEDDGYIFLKATPAYEFVDKKYEKQFYMKRPYHYYLDDKEIKPVEFLSFSPEQAISKFLSRKELYS